MQKKSYFSAGQFSAGIGAQHRLFTCLICIFTTILSSCQPQGGMRNKINTSSISRKWLDQAYAASSAAQKLDLYLPETGDGPFPLIIHIHGGAFKMGDKADAQVNPMLEGLKRSYAVASINYRLSGEAIYPAQIHDIKAAIRFLRANASTYKLDPEKFAVWGGSAGANLAAMAGTSGDVKEMENVDMGNPKISSRVQAVVDWFGPINFNTMDAQFKVSGKGRTDHDEANSPESLLLGKKITEAQDLVAFANPTSYITVDDPAFFIEHGKEDQLVPCEQSIEFAAALEKVLGKDKVQLILLDNTRHGGPQFETPENLNRVFAFLDAALK